MPARAGSEGGGGLGALVALLKQCGDNLTRENIMKQAASLKGVSLPLLLPGITLNTTAPGLILELFGSFGYYAGTTASSTRTGQIAYTSSAPLPYGPYVVRIRLDPSKTFSNGTVPFSLTVN